MKRCSRFLLILFLLLLISFYIGNNIWAGNDLKKNPLRDIKNFVFFYGKGNVDKLEKYDLVVIQDYTLTKDEVQYLKSKGIKVVVYVTIGESDVDPNTIGIPQNCVLGKNENWNSWFIDARCEVWQNLVLTKMKNLINEKGYDGFFLDTLDTAVIYPDTKPGMVNLVKKIRDSFPNAILIQNRGFQLLEDTGKYIDAVLWEDFASGYNFVSGKYEKNTISDALVKKQKDLAEKYGYIILALDYSDEDDVELINYVKSQWQKYGILGSITDLYISKIYDLSKPVKPREYATDNIDQLVIMGKNDKDYIYGDGWKDLENIYGTFARRCEGWSAGVVLTFKEKKDSIFYVTIYDGGVQDLALKITTYNGQNWPFIASIPVGDSEAFKTYEVKIKKEEMYDNDPNVPFIQQKFGFQGARVLFIGYPNKPEIHFGKYEITKKKDRIYFRVGNAGLLSAKNVEVLVLDSNNNVLEKFFIDELKPNEVKEMEYKFPKGIDISELFLKADPDNKIDEIIKENNILKVNVK
jgi:hypothetical protein